MFHSLGKRHRYLCIGSVIDYYCDYQTSIWGSGVMLSSSILPERPSKVLTVRGPLTRDFLIKQGIDCPTVYGDPVLLLLIVLIILIGV